MKQYVVWHMKLLKLKHSLRVITMITCEALRDVACEAVETENHNMGSIVLCGMAQSENYDM